MLDIRTNLALYGALCIGIVRGCHLSEELVVKKGRTENGMESQQKHCHLFRLTDQLGSHK